ncbi:hypothetical protein PBC1_029 [Bacillus phage PBC1]|uniref:Uncharacterized protein n=1 Tax=Bacillus phage PBC1 TaxID=1161901 RepID=I1TLG3_9CAUD|nr:hypothetical protein PBC1_gp29 [Bacillus phage PBC1]AFE86265.1 hypothetical protein PBC1_029 [Bacillus phage PBC1]
MENCCHAGCTSPATYTGYIYGRVIDDKSKPDHYIPVVVCTFHAQHPDLWQVRKILKYHFTNSKIHYMM